MLFSKEPLHPILSSVFAAIFCSLLPLTFTIAGQIANSPPREIPVELLGTWQVTDVLTNVRTTRRLNYQFQDPRLKGRIFTFNPQQLDNNAPENLLCAEPRITAKKISAGELFTNSLGGDSPSPNDYQLQIQSNKHVEVMTLTCKESGLFGASLGHVIHGAWIVQLDKNKIIFRWYDETILVLQRMPENAKPVASFNCSKAVSITEKAICSSIALAAYDLSVSTSYKSTLRFLQDEGDTQAIATIKSSQKEWLHQRNDCGSDTKCLEKLMRERLEVIQTSIE